MNCFEISETKNDTQKETLEEKEKRLAEVWARMEILRKKIGFSLNGYGHTESIHKNK